jgi:uncharacterized short protein YbdD (DUF466 family)
MTVRWREALVALRCYLREVAGETAYERHVDHLRRHHPDVASPEWRAFWRERMDRRDENPGARCC